MRTAETVHGTRSPRGPRAAFQHRSRRRATAPPRSAGAASRTDGRPGRVIGSSESDSPSGEARSSGFGGEARSSGPGSPEGVGSSAGEARSSGAPPFRIAAGIRRRAAGIPLTCRAATAAALATAMVMTMVVRAATTVAPATGAGPQVGPSRGASTPVPAMSAMDRAGASATATRTGRRPAAATRPPGTYSRAAATSRGGRRSLQLAMEFLSGCRPSPRPRGDGTPQARRDGWENGMGESCITVRITAYPQAVMR